MANVYKNAQSLMNFLKKTGGYFKHLDKVNIIKAEKGNLLAELKIDKEHVNQFGTMHGGLAATIIDTYSCGAYLTNDNAEDSMGSSVELHVRYFKGAKLGDNVVINVETEKLGKYLAYMKCDIKSKNTGEVLSTGTQTLYIWRNAKLAID